MATIISREAPAEGGTRFYTIMAFVMSAVIVGGFVVNFATGRSTFAVPLAYHVHAGVFMGWIALYLAQHLVIGRGSLAMHVRLGKLAYLWIPAMLISGLVLMVVVTRRTGGPFFFNVSEFLFSNIAMLLCFAGLAWWALRARRHSGWHRRLMVCAMTSLLGPGLGRLMPMPLLIPYAWTITQLMAAAFPVIGMIADKRRDGVVHPAYKWGLAIYLVAFAASMALAFSPLGYALTEALVAGTPGAERPMDAFIPEGLGL
jgi:hypothetical protein